MKNKERTETLANTEVGKKKGAKEKETDKKSKQMR